MTLFKCSIWCLVMLFKGNDVLLYAMIVLENYLSGSISSPIYQEMVLNKHLAVSAETDFNYLRRGGSTFSLYAYFQRPENTSKIKDVFLKNIKATVKKLTPQELEKVKKQRIELPSAELPKDELAEKLMWYELVIGIQHLGKHLLAGGVYAWKVSPTVNDTVRKLKTKKHLIS